MASINEYMIDRNELLMASINENIIDTSTRSVESFLWDQQLMPFSSVVHPISNYKLHDQTDILEILENS
jgi:hypothetical protein